MSTVASRRAPYPVRTNHKQCAKCGKLVARGAFECRRCGKRQRVRPRTVLLALSGCLLVAMFAVAGSSAFSNAPPVVQTSSAPAAGPAEGRSGTRVSAADLWLEYARDPAGADHRFRDRPVVVSGTVRSIERDFDGRLMVRLSTGDALETVNAKLAMRDDPAIAGLAKGKALSLGCVGRGALIGAPLLGNCSVVN
jgi:hypothetical protein